MSDLVQLLANGGVQSRVAMSVNVAPETADSIDILAAFGVDQYATFRAFDQPRLELGHLRKGMPDVSQIPGSQLFRVGTAGAEFVDGGVLVGHDRS